MGFIVFMVVGFIGFTSGCVSAVVGSQVADMLDEKFQQRRNRQNLKEKPIANNKFKD